MKKILISARNQELMLEKLVLKMRKKIILDEERLVIEQKLKKKLDIRKTLRKFDQFIKEKIFEQFERIQSKENENYSEF